MRPTKVAVAAGVAAWLWTASASALADVSNDQLAAQATDPTASLMSFQLLNWYTPSFRDLDGSANQVVLRAAIPFTLAGTNNIFRVTLPYFTTSPGGGGGLSDTQIFNLTVFGAGWGRWGLGLSGSLPTGQAGFTTDKYTLGPAAGFVNSATEGFNWGLFAQTFFSFAGNSAAADIGIVNVQPIASVQLGGGRSLSLGNSAFIYDTEKSRWASLLLGVNYGQVVSLWGHRWRPNVEVDYDLRDLPGNQRWVFRIGVALLVPSL